jgi:signal transduction histidine kinase
VSALSGVGRVLGRVRHPQTTVRWRLTLLYGAVFLVSGAVLLTVTYVLVDHAPISREPGGLFVNSQSGPAAGFAKQSTVSRPATAKPHTALPGDFSQLPSRIRQVLRSSEGQTAIRIVGAKQRVADLHQLIVESSIALAIMAILSAALGWLVAGRVLRPLRTMTATAQQISEANLHQRLALDGPRDELRQLADTIDRLLARLESAFDAQRRFVANASHELRTPLTSARALLEMVMSDPHATVATYRSTCQQVLEESEEQEQLIDSLLALAQGERGIDRHDLLDLAAVTEDALCGYRARAGERGLRVDTSLASAHLTGDRRLVERLVANLLENALRHNVPDGHISLVVRSDRGAAELLVTNTGPVVPAEEIPRLLQPFQRLGAARAGRREGFGLGLSIVAAIAGAHHAQLDAQPVPGGGLAVRVRFPVPADPGSPLPAPGLGEPPAGLGEGGAGHERAEWAWPAAHTQGPVRDDLKPGAEDDVDRPVLTAGDPAHRLRDVSDDGEPAPQQR